MCTALFFHATASPVDSFVTATVCCASNVAWCDGLMHTVAYIRRAGLGPGKEPDPLLLRRSSCTYKGSLLRVRQANIRKLFAARHRYSTKHPANCKFTSPGQGVLQYNLSALVLVSGHGFGANFQCCVSRKDVDVRATRCYSSGTTATSISSTTASLSMASCSCA